MNLTSVMDKKWGVGRGIIQKHRFPRTRILTCNHHAQTGGTCDSIEFRDTSDNVWSVGDEIIIRENGQQDLCGINQACDIENCEITGTITDVQEGKVISQNTVNSS